MGEKKNVITNLVELGKRNQKITTKEINDALEEIGFEVELVDKLYEALDANNIEIVDEPDADVEEFTLTEETVDELESAAQAQQLTPAPEEETSAVEEEPSSTAGEEPAAAVAVNQVLVDESGIKITYTGMEMTEEGNAELRMTVENNSEQPILVNVQDFSANGMMMNAMFATQVTPGKKSNDELTIYASTLEENGVTAVESVEFSLVVFNDDTLDTIVKTDLIALTV